MIASNPQPESNLPSARPKAINQDIGCEMNENGNSLTPVASKPHIQTALEFSTAFCHVPVAHERLSRRRYNLLVARGWESKSVELQQDEARSSAEPKSRMTIEQKKNQARKEGLRLTRSRILAQLHSSENSRYRQMLERSLAEIEEQLKQVGGI
jgi:hypothetical protein